MFLLAAGCIMVQNASGLEDAEGPYIKDSNLTDCNNLNLPRYRHIDGTSFLWAYQNPAELDMDIQWLGTTLLCDNASETTLFRAKVCRLHPTWVPLDQWEVVKRDRSSPCDVMQSWRLHVKVVPEENSGKLQNEDKIVLTIIFNSCVFHPSTAFGLLIKP